MLQSLELYINGKPLAQRRMAQIRERFTLLQDFEELREKVDKDEERKAAHAEL